MDRERRRGRKNERREEKDEMKPSERAPVTCKLLDKSLGEKKNNPVVELFAFSFTQRWQITLQKAPAGQTLVARALHCSSGWCADHSSQWASVTGL